MTANTPGDGRPDPASADPRPCPRCGEDVVPVAKPLGIDDDAEPPGWRLECPFCAPEDGSDPDDDGPHVFDTVTEADFEDGDDA